MTGAYGSDETSKELAAGLRDFLDEQCDLARLREAWTDLRFDVDLWRSISSLGFAGALVPESRDGLGVPAESIVSSLDVLGYSGAALPLADTAAVIAPMIDRHGSDDQRESILPGLLGGEIIGASTVLVGGDRALFAPDASVVLFDRDEHLYLLSRDDFDVIEVHSPDPMSRVGRVLPRDGALNDSTLIAEGGVQDARARAAWAAAAVLNGVSRRMLDLTVEHAKTREQFGRPIGTFQAVKHLVADAWVAIESSRPTVWYAAHASDEGLPDAVNAASVAKAAASDAARTVSDIALQVHGGIGFTWEHPLHIWMKRAKLLENSYGSREYHLRTLGAAMRDEAIHNDTIFASA